MLLRLTQPGEGTEDTRAGHPSPRLATAADGARVDRVIEEMSAARLLVVTADDATESPPWRSPHEALIRHGRSAAGSTPTGRRSASTAD